MNTTERIDRRGLLAAGASAVAGGGVWPWLTEGRAATTAKPKKVAAVVTAYAKGLHADVLLGKILDGWEQDGGPGPALELVSMYLDQFPEKDLARTMSKKFGIPIFETIAGAVTVGGSSIPVDGVISIGEHGRYPRNAKGQVLYPRRRFFEEITDAFRKYGRVVPVFNDKHLGPVWSDAKWMYDRAKELDVPFMAGSSMTVGYRTPEIKVPMECGIESAVAIGYSGLDIYGSHTLEFLQCHVERRRGAETGVKWVQCLQGRAMWKVLDDGLISKETFAAALKQLPRLGGGHYVDMRESDRSTLFLFEYNDGLMGAVFMLPETIHGTSVALKLKGRDKPVATRFDERTEPSYPHFAWLLKSIERMIHTRKPSCPVERTLLTSGILDRALTSLQRHQQKLPTPELGIRYQPVDYPHAPLPALDSAPA